jgi:hypothetical protein
LWQQCHENSFTGIEPNLETVLWVWTRKDRWAAVLTGLLVLVYLIYFFDLAIGSDFVLKRIAWTTAWDGGFGTHAQVFSLEGESVSWLVTTGFLQDTFSVQRVGDGDIQTWAIPASIGGWRELGTPAGIASDRADRFWVICSEQVVHWTGDAWQTMPFLPDGTTLDLYGTGLVTQGTQLWATTRTGDASGAGLFTLDLNGGDLQAVPLPTSALQEGLVLHHRLHPLAGGTFLALTEGKNRHRLYFFNGDGWQEPGYNVEIAPSSEIVDFTRGPAGRLWVLVETLAENSYSVGWLDPKALTWTWNSLVPGCESCRTTYYSVEVDARGRVWLAGYSHRGQVWSGPVLDVFEPQPGGTARYLVRYTSDNSNAQDVFGRPLRLGPDGRLWAADGRLVWIDSTAQDLPQPLPDWIVIATSSTSRLVAALVMFVLNIVLLWGVMAARRAQR